jgi:integrase
VIDRMGNRRWVLRLTINGKRVNRGLGPYSKVSLARAREKATELRAAAKDGKDLHLEAKAKSRSGRAPLDTIMTFRRAFAIYFEEAKRPTLMPGRFAERWVGSMEEYAFPCIGDRPVADISPREIIEMLQPIWHTKRETASRVLQRVSATFKSAIVRGYRTAGNPTEGVREELGKARPKVQHRRALPWQEVPAFLQWLHARPRATLATRLCLELIVLTSLRSEEVRFAKWDEFDRDAAEWTVPGIDPVESARLGYPKKTSRLVVCDGYSMDCLVQSGEGQGIFR